MRSVRHAFVRAFLALLAVLTVAAPAAASVGEGLLASRAGRSPVVVHVEDARHAACPYVHADNCVLCGVLTLQALPATVRVPRLARTIAGARIVAPDTVARRVLGAAAAPNARGPPQG